jgi:hypothetical protein
MRETTRSRFFLVFGSVFLFLFCYAVIDLFLRGEIRSSKDSPMSNLLLSVMGAFAQFERELLRERQREGIALAKRAGKYRVSVLRTSVTKQTGDMVYSGARQ